MGSPNATSSAGAALEPIEVAAKRAAASKQDSCTWNAGGKCSSPVVCEACINTALSEQTCGFGPSGTCVAMAAYQPTYPIDSSVLYFPSVNFTYCNASDETCSSCKSAWKQEYRDTGVYPMNKLCQGERGCICVSQCESPSFAAKVLTSQCSLFGDAVGPAKHVYSAVSALGVAAIGIAIFRAWRREKRAQAQEQERRERQEHRRRERAAQRGIKGPPQLSLTGWKALQEKLLTSEREILDGDKKTLEELGSATAPDATRWDGGSSQHEDGVGGFATDDESDGAFGGDLEEGTAREEKNRSRPNTSARVEEP